MPSLVVAGQSHAGALKGSTGSEISAGSGRRRYLRVLTSGHENRAIGVYLSDCSETGLGEECVWFGGRCGPTSCVNILSVPRFVPVSFPLCLPSPAPTRYLSFTSPLFNQPAHRHPSAISALSQVLLEQAGFPAGGPDGSLASRPAPGL